MTCAAVVFDLDGTLVDSLSDIARSTNIVLAQLGHPVHELDAYRRFIGDGVATLFSRALPADVSGDSALIADCVRRFGDVYDVNWNVDSRPYDGIAELLDELTRAAMPLAVLSNKPHRFTVQCMREFFPDREFAVVFGQRDGVPRKPDPAGALEIADLLHVAPRDCLYLGDSLVDMQTAVRAGMIPVGALWGFRSREELEAHGAAHVIANPGELLPFVRTPSTPGRWLNE